MDKMEYAFGLPRGTVRGTVFILIVVGFIGLVFGCLYGIITGKMTIQDSVTLITLYVGVALGPVIVFYFDGKKSKDEREYTKLES